MKKNHCFLFIPLLFLLLGLGKICWSEIEKEDSIKIVTTIFPLREFAEAVAGDRGTVDLLLPPGAEIHSWQPKPSDLVKLSSSDLFVYIGADLEPWAEDILRSVRNPHLKIVEASRGLLLLGAGGEAEPHEHQSSPVHKFEAIDPHVWLDFENDEKIVDSIEKALAEIDPGGKKIFLQNAFLYKQKLRGLDEKYRKGLESCGQRTIVLGGHGAFGYLTRRYNLTQVSLYGLSPDSMPTPSQLIEVIRFVNEEKIKAIYFEWNLSHELAEVIAHETGARTLSLNPGANSPFRKKDSEISFLAIMEKNLESLRDGLNCR
jgi:zinc transport system substrate-binding protein